MQTCSPCTPQSQSIDLFRAFPDALSSIFSSIETGHSVSTHGCHASERGISSFEETPGSAHEHRAKNKRQDEMPTTTTACHEEIEKKWDRKQCHEQMVVTLERRTIRGCELTVQEGFSGGRNAHTPRLSSTRFVVIAGDAPVADRRAAAPLIRRSGVFGRWRRAESGVLSLLGIPFLITSAKTLTSKPALTTQHPNCSEESRQTIVPSCDELFSNIALALTRCYCNSSCSPRDVSPICVCAAT
jgi:hypothetical protein